MINVLVDAGRGLEKQSDGLVTQCFKLEPTNEEVAHRVAEALDVVFISLTIVARSTCSKRSTSLFYHHVTTHHTYAFLKSNSLMTSLAFEDKIRVPNVRLVKEGDDLDVGFLSIAVDVRQELVELGIAKDLKGSYAHSCSVLHKDVDFFTLINSDRKSVMLLAYLICLFRIVTLPPPPAWTSS